jgi:ribosomal protein S18 acetylase RimI-like enzyme
MAQAILMQFSDMGDKAIAMANHGVIEPVASERRQVSLTLAEAFQDDPVMSFIFPDPEDRRMRLPRLFAILFEGDGAHGARFATSAYEAATLWRAPGKGHLSWFEKLQHGLPWLHAAGFSLARALSVSAASDAAHPTAPHWYLHIAGCRPQSRRQGFASAAIGAGLARADKEHVFVYLETANEANIGFYEHLGFAVAHEWRVPNGPKHWSMKREPNNQE